jgi:hypothetical protein
MLIGFADESIAQVDFTVDTDWHTYRLEVSGNNLRLLFDGSEVARGIDNRQLAPGTVGIFCRYGQVNVRSFRVVAM